MLGLDLSYTLGSFSLSAPQTTERRIKDQEGSSETPEQSMKWVWIATGKMLVYTGFPSLMQKSWWPLAGGLVAIADMHGSYRYAIRCGKRSHTPGGDMVGQMLGDTPGGRPLRFR